MGNKKIAFINPARIKSYFSQDLPKPNLFYCTHPIEDLKNNIFLNKWLARLILKRLLISFSKIENQISSNKLAHLYNLLEELFNLEFETISLFFQKPEITHIYYQLEQKARENDSNVDEIITYFNTFLLLYLFSKRLIKKTEKIQIVLTTPFFLNIYSTNKNIVFLNPIISPVTAEIQKNDIIIHNKTKKYIISLEDLLSQETALLPLRKGYRIETYPMLQDKLIITDNEFYKKFFFVKNNDPNAIWEHIKESNFSTWRTCLKESMQLLEKHWKEGWKEFKTNILQLAPLKPEKFNQPKNYSLHSLRGMIFTSCRPSYMIAQTLMHEAGHNKFSTILDLYTLLKNSPDEKYYSPFVQTDRPIIYIIHGIFSFLRDLDLSLRMINQVNEGNNDSIERYINLIQQRIQEGVEIVRKNAIFNENGAILMDSLESHFNRIRS